MPLATFSSWSAPQMRRRGCRTSNILCELESKPWAGTGGRVLPMSPCFLTKEGKGVGSSAFCWLSCCKHFCCVATPDLLMMNSLVWWNRLLFTTWTNSHHVSLCNLSFHKWCHGSLPVESLWTHHVSVTHCVHMQLCFTCLCFTCPIRQTNLIFFLFESFAVSLSISFFISSLREYLLSDTSKWQKPVTPK